MKRKVVEEGERTLTLRVNGVYFSMLALLQFYLHPKQQQQPINEVRNIGSACFGSRMSGFESLHPDQARSSTG